MSSDEQSPRVMLVRVPDWPIRAVQMHTEHSDPLIVAEKGRVLTCCRRAAEDGVLPGLRVRAAQLRCPRARVVVHDPRVEEEGFAPVVARIEEQVAPAVHVLRPGTAVVPVGGPARFYGGERAAAERLWQVLGQEGWSDATVGVADGMFAAEQAALGVAAVHRGTRTPTGQPVPIGESDPIRIVPAGRSREFLADLEVGALVGSMDDCCTDGGMDLVVSLRTLGLRTMGLVTTLSREQAATRFGRAGRLAHQYALGQDPRPLVPHRSDHDDTVEIAFEDPVASVEQLEQAVRPTLERLIGEIGSRGLICDTVRILIRSTAGVCERTWRHPWQFGSDDLVCRVRWQLAELDRPRADTAEEVVCEYSTGVQAVQLIPTCRPLADHAEGLFGARPAEHLVQILTRLQARLGPRAVLVPSVAGGRLLTERRRLTPFGSVPDGARTGGDQPWPGRLTGPAPSVIYSEPRPVRVQTLGGQSVHPLEDAGGSAGEDPPGGLDAEPGWLIVPGGRRVRVIAWAGPWPVREHWWTDRAVSLDRYQFVTEDQEAWVLVAASSTWWLEARYD
ncbi:DNA polymerase Y family protein [Acidipropionibacterium jensenii]|uniref:DNA polymerase IV n=3 Tax=Acidipropionibacterium jensenii TaxID=1749 RepID=A0A448P261_9ACTN|nr:DNA polymerase Y family protein [Acidipropionibacterium jensenii]MDN5996378.1 DNA polymerase Y family protein [Acidipropionibacterium jensenii]MDN6426637.1 DNA polymerase Y family protein [Acidipropionibacterium jensenii]MDN6480412.1 DNA polymerase Y family protein [Acidipropionibacterium jensenii]MDN6761504.1 DNA polymerase Y family protein [Acidipropionibacterium jensenii]MDN6791482.1 DNA polymerase Y family protein [Acidipropionibacterium jensenii]